MKDVISLDEGKKFFDLLSTKKFYIPIYQREYQWTEPQINRLLEDYIEACENNSQEHFIGSLLYQQDSVSNRYILVDGQQRTTSLFLMYIAIILAGFTAGFCCKDKAKRTQYFIKWATIPGQFGIGKTKFSEHIKYASECEQIRFDDLVEKLDELLAAIHESVDSWLTKIVAMTEEETNSSITLIDKTISNLEKINSQNKKNKLEQNNFISNFVHMYKSFLEEITIEDKADKVPEYDLDKMYKYLQVPLVDILFVPIKIENEIHAIPVFNEINTTGVKLNDAELIRSYLICHDQVYTEVLDYIEIEINKHVQNNSKLSAETLYQEFILAVVGACKNRANLKKYRKKYDGDIENKTKVTYSLYENFKRAYDFLKLNKDPEYFALLLRRYFDYFKLVKKFDTNYIDNRFYKSLNLEDKVSKKFNLILEAFDYDLLNTYMSEIFVLFERVDQNINRDYNNKELSPLSFELFFKVLHTLWAFVVRVNVNSQYYPPKKISNSTIDISACSEDEIYDKLLSRLDEQSPKVSKEFDTKELFKESLLKNPKVRKKYPYYLLKIVDISLKDNNQSDNRILCSVLPAAKNLSKSWENSLKSTTSLNWNKVKRFSGYPDKFNLFDNDPSMKDILNKLDDSLQSVLGNYILVNESSKSNIESQVDFNGKKAAFIHDRSLDNITEFLKSKNEWGFAEIIDLSDLYADILIEALSFNSKVFMN